MAKQNFEAQLVSLLNEYFNNTKQDAKAVHPDPPLNNCAKAIRLRQPQPYGGYQDADILVLSPLQRYRLAIECKSVLEPTQKTIYFKSHFTIDKKGQHQVTRMTDFCAKTGMCGILAVKLRSGVKGAKGEIRFVPWRVVNRLFEDGEKSISYETVRKWPEFKKVSGVYNLEECLDSLQFSLDE